MGVYLGTERVDIHGLDEVSGDSYYDVFWDNFQMNGTRTNYEGAFYNVPSATNNNYWNSYMLYPKYDIKGTNYLNCFRSMSGELDLVERLQECGISIDTSNATTMDNMYRYSEFTKIPTTYFTSITSRDNTAYYIFASSAKLHTIEKIITAKHISYQSTFDGCSELVNVIFEGEIGNFISFKSSQKLSDESIQSIIDGLADLTGQTTQTLTFTSSVKEKLTETQIATITNKNWTLA